ncbi:MAG TPA: hypothetical protein VD996_09800, partial [Chitinophagaceae bacterium]|nr:hypothetical protein [Chitinophagaceae bacterium]
TTGQELINSTDGQLIPDEPANVPPVTNQESSASEQIVPQKKTVEKPLDTNLQKPVTEQPVTDAVAINTAKKEEEAPVKKTVAKPVAPNLEKYVAVSSNDYQVGPFGGISKLALTVKNSSEYDLNLVVVQVEYLKVNKEVFKTENLYFRDVAANSSLTLDAPRSTRGNKVNYKVTLINSKDHLFHAGN